MGTTSLTTLTTTVNASSGLPTSTTKDYNKMLKLAQKDGITYTKPRYFNDWVPGNNVGDYYTMKPYKLSGSLIDPGRQWDKVVEAGTIHGRAFFVVKDNSDGKRLVPAEFYHVPYGFKFKKITNLLSVTMAIDGQDKGKNQGFFIGLAPVHMSDGKDYYPVYSYTTSDVLGVVYIKTADIDQFEPAKVTYKYIGTLNKSKGSSYCHSFKPYKNKVNY